MSDSKLFQKYHAEWLAERESFEDMMQGVQRLLSHGYCPRVEVRAGRKWLGVVDPDIDKTITGWCPVTDVEAAMLEGLTP